MDYASQTFAAFLALTLGAYLVLPRRAQNVLLLAASLWFYYGICDAGPFALCLLVSLGTEFVVAQKIAKAPGKPEKRRWLALSIAVELGILGFFKLHGFFVAQFAAVARAIGLPGSEYFHAIALPLAISFYTFQCLGYTIDVYRGQQKPETDLVDFALFVVVFFKLVAGPIERGRKLLPQIKAPRTPTAEGFLQGCALVFVGIFKKLAVADKLAPVAHVLAPPDLPPGVPHYHGIDVLLATTLRALAIYAEFSGYTDAMRGLARMFGFEVSSNFKAPFLARNIQEFWGRWHITLTSWIRDYLYMPMVLSKRWKWLGSGGLALVTMLVMGLWHGAKATFLLWGLWHGLLLALYGKARPWLYRATSFEGEAARRAWHVACILMVFGCCVFGGILFNARYLGTVGRELRDIVLHPDLGPGSAFAFAVCLLRFAPVLVLDLLDDKSPTPDRFLTIRWLPRTLLQLAMLVLLLDAVLHAKPSNPFQYF